VVLATLLCSPSNVNGGPNHNPEPTISIDASVFDIIAGSNITVKFSAKNAEKVWLQKLNQDFNKNICNKKMMKNCGSMSGCEDEITFNPREDMNPEEKMKGYAVYYVFSGSSVRLSAPADFKVLLAYPRINELYIQDYPMARHGEKIHIYITAEMATKAVVSCKKNGGSTDEEVLLKKVWEDASGVEARESVPITDAIEVNEQCLKQESINHYGNVYKVHLIFRAYNKYGVVGRDEIREMYLLP
jgi:hypothetical protein